MELPDPSSPHPTMEQPPASIREQWGGRPSLHANPPPVGPRSPEIEYARTSWVLLCLGKKAFYISHSPGLKYKCQLALLPPLGLHLNLVDFRHG